MTVEEFWTLVERSGVITLDKDDRAEWLTEQLTALPLDAVIGFEACLTTERKRVDTWLMWDAADHVMSDHCSTDGFFYFQPWLIGLGRESFDRVAADPDSLAELSVVRELAGRPLSDWAEDEWPEWESLNYVALHAYERVAGVDGLDAALEALGLDRVCDPAPQGDRVAGSRLPRLVALLG